MTQYKLLILTDHATHSDENSLYSLTNHMRLHKACKSIDIASRGNEKNDAFFHKLQTRKLWVKEINQSIDFDPLGKQFMEDATEQKDIGDYDFILLRLPHPITKGFFDFLEKRFPPKQIINRPSGIRETGSKAFLVNFPELCAPTILCHNMEDIKAFKQRFPIVLKPIESYGGKGIYKIDGEEVFLGNEKLSWEQFSNQLTDKDFPILAMQFLDNLHLGDKRIIVVDGHIIGASLRTPVEGSWLCNVTQGGSSAFTQVDEDEKNIVATLCPILKEKGVLFCGIDTLVNNEGKRVLSEINTLSIGGLKQIQQLSGQPLLEKITNILWDYCGMIKK